MAVRFTQSMLLFVCYLFDCAWGEKSTYLEVLRPQLSHKQHVVDPDKIQIYMSERASCKNDNIGGSSCQVTPYGGLSRRHGDQSMSV